MKIWRTYDYAHVFMLYFHMHQIAQRYSDLVTFRDSDGYLELAWQTARAFFEYAYEIYPWDDIYKWGFYNELLVPEIIHAIEERGGGGATTAHQGFLQVTDLAVLLEAQAQCESFGKQDMREHGPGVPAPGQAILESLMGSATGSKVAVGGFGELGHGAAVLSQD